MSKSLVLTMTPQLGLTSQNPSAYYWRPKQRILRDSLLVSNELMFKNINNHTLIIENRSGEALKIVNLEIGFL